MHFRLLIPVIVLTAAGCQKKAGDDLPEPPKERFETTPVAKTVLPGFVDEASGIADSKINPGHLWVEQDGGNSNEIFLLKHDGTYVKSIEVSAAVNHDWEDMAIADGPVAGTSYIYLADVGDNDQVYGAYAIYRFAEPASGVAEVTTVDKISFTYPDGAHDADAILVDNDTKDIYIITKKDASSRIYKLAYPQRTDAVNQAQFIANLSFTGVTSAALSPDGKEVLVRTYEKIYHWKKGKEQTLAALLAEAPVSLTYQVEPQGEAICFKNDNSGFFTLSERPVIVPGVQLNFYKRK